MQLWICVASVQTVAMYFMSQNGGDLFSPMSKFLNIYSGIEIALYYFVVISF